MSYSPVLEYMLDRLNGFSTNYFKILPQNSQSANSGAIVRFTMPSKFTFIHEKRFFEIQ
jgi:hypothetical protein